MYKEKEGWLVGKCIVYIEVYQLRGTFNDDNGQMATTMYEEEETENG